MGRIRIINDISYSSNNLGTITYITNESYGVFKITALENLTISFSRDLQYNDGSTTYWKLLEANTELEVTANTIIGFKSNIVPTSEDGIGTFVVSGDFNVSGNILDLIADNELREFGFKNLFKNCTTLIDASELSLPKTTKKSCYEGMFYGCTSLTTSPVLISKTLTENCYKDMFYGCSYLNNIKCYNVEDISEYVSSDWVNGVASTGTLYINCKGDWNETNEASHIPENWTINNDYNGYHLKYFTIDILNDGVFTFGPVSEQANNTGYNYYPENFTVDYSINDDEWVSVVVPTSGITLDVFTGDKIRFRGTNTYYCYTSGADPHKQWYFVFGVGTEEAKGSGYTKTTAKFNVYGNTMSLLYGDDFVEQTILPSNFVFCGLFNGAMVVSAENMILPAPVLTENCYRAMFSHATYLTISPVLPAKNIVSGCYKYMFEHTENIKQITCLAETGLYITNPTDPKGTHGLTSFVVFDNTNGHTVPHNVVFIKSPNTGYSDIGSDTEWCYNKYIAAGIIYCSGILKLKIEPWTIIDYEEP